MSGFALFLAILWSIALILDVIRWAMGRNQTTWKIGPGSGPRWIDVFLPEGLLVFLLWIDYLNTLG